jgi:hypothetical protein
MTVQKSALLLIALAYAGNAVAQTTNCMSIGTGMVHCDSMGSNGSIATSDCVSTGPGTAHCSSSGSGYSHSQGGVLVTLIQAAQEKSFQKELTRRLESGDCDGASRFALSKGRAAVSDSIRRSCVPKPVAVTKPNTNAREDTSAKVDVDPIALEEKLRAKITSVNAAMPLRYDDTTTFTKAEAVGTQILMTATVSLADIEMTDARRARIQNQMCATSGMPELLKQGASLRIKYFELNGREIGSVMVTRAECGL